MRICNAYKMDHSDSIEKRRLGIARVAQWGSLRGIGKI